MWPWQGWLKSNGLLCVTIGQPWWENQWTWRAQRRFTRYARCVSSSTHWLLDEQKPHWTKPPEKSTFFGGCSHCFISLRELVRSRTCARSLSDWFLSKLLQRARSRYPNVTVTAMHVVPSLAFCTRMVSCYARIAKIQATEFLAVWMNSTCASISLGTPYSKTVNECDDLRLETLEWTVARMKSSESLRLLRFSMPPQSLEEERYLSFLFRRNLPQSLRKHTVPQIMVILHRLPIDENNLIFVSSRLYITQKTKDT